MKKKIIAAMPFLIMPIFIPIYVVLDNLILVDVFGCGCVPIIQTNMLNISFNANDLRLVVFATLTIGMCAWGINISKRFAKKSAKLLYYFAVLVYNVTLAMWVVKTFLWA